MGNTTTGMTTTTEPGSGGASTNSGGSGSGGVSGTGSTNSGSGGDPGGAAGGTPGQGECTDEPPDSNYTCTEQAGWGKCGEPWMADFCDLSCGRCGDLPGADCGVPGTPPDLMADAGEAPPLSCEAAPADECAFGGLVHACKDRFALGINYAWRDFATDFGGLEAWSLGGISGNPDIYNSDLSNMKANGASVIRWWMFPDFRGDGVLLDEEGVPTGISEGAIADIQLALELAQRNDLYLVPTIFSFDNFRPDRMEGTDVDVVGISDLVSSQDGRAALIDHVVTPIAQAVADSPYASRVLGWDVINEPEWAIAPAGHDPASEDFTPNDELTPVSLEDMKAFINGSLSALGTITPHALRSVGWAAAKWAWAFEDVTDIEFNQPHIYSWVNAYWPYTTPPDELGYPDRPVVMGEFYLLDGPFDSADPSFETVMNSWYESGYAGAWPWQYFDGCVARPGTEGLDLNMIGSFATDKGCSVSY